MNRLRLCALAATLTMAPLFAKADTVINLNATTGSATTSYGGGYNNLAPTFFSTVTLGPGTYSLSVIGAGVTSGGTTSVYSGWAKASPAANNYVESVGITSGGSFTQASIANGYQNSYTLGTTPAGLSSLIFDNGTRYATAATALAASSGTPYLFTLASTTALTFYIPDNSFLPSFNYYGFDDNSGGVSLSLKAVTPEPSSLMLLGTGVVGLAGTIKRRFLA